MVVFFVFGFGENVKNCCVENVGLVVVVLV